MTNYVLLTNVPYIGSAVAPWEHSKEFSIWAEIQTTNNTVYMQYCNFAGYIYRTASEAILGNVSGSG